MPTFWDIVLSCRIVRYQAFFALVTSSVWGSPGAVCAAWYEKEMRSGLLEVCIA